MWRQFSEKNVFSSEKNRICAQLNDVLVLFVYSALYFIPFWLCKCYACRLEVECVLWGIYVEIVSHGTKTNQIVTSKWVSSLMRIPNRRAHRIWFQLKGCHSKQLFQVYLVCTYNLTHRIRMIPAAPYNFEDKRSLHQRYDFTRRQQFFHQFFLNIFKISIFPNRSKQKFANKFTIICFCSKTVAMNQFRTLTS